MMSTLVLPPEKRFEMPDGTARPTTLEGIVAEELSESLQLEVPSELIHQLREGRWIIIDLDFEKIALENQANRAESLDEPFTDIREAPISVKYMGEIHILMAGIKAQQKLGVKEGSFARKTLETIIWLGAACLLPVLPVPQSWNILVKRRQPIQMRGGIMIPEASLAMEEALTPVGRVCALGNRVFTDSLKYGTLAMGRVGPPDFMTCEDNYAVGDQVIFHRHSGQNLTIVDPYDRDNTHNFVILCDDSVVAKVPRPDVINI